MGEQRSLPSAPMRGIRSYSSVRSLSVQCRISFRNSSCTQILRNLVLSASDFFDSQIILKFCSKHDSIAAQFSAKFLNDLTIPVEQGSGRDFMRLKIKLLIGFGGWLICLCHYRVVLGSVSV